MHIEIRFRQIAQGLFDFKGENRGHTGIQQGPQIRQMIAALDMGRQKAAGKIHRLFQIFQGLDFHAGKGVNDRQIICGIGKSDFGVGIIG